MLFPPFGYCACGIYYGRALKRSHLGNQSMDPGAAPLSLILFVHECSLCEMGRLGLSQGSCEKEMTQHM